MLGIIVLVVFFACVCYAIWCDGSNTLLELECEIKAAIKFFRGVCIRLEGRMGHEVQGVDINLLIAHHEVKKFVETSMVNIILSERITYRVLKSRITNNDKFFKTYFKESFKMMVFTGRVGIYPRGILYYENAMDLRHLESIFVSKGSLYCALWIMKGFLTKILRFVQGLRRWLDPLQRNDAGQIEDRVQVSLNNNSRLKVKANILEKEVEQLIFENVLDSSANLKNISNILARNNVILDKCIKIVLKRQILKGRYGIYPGGEIYPAFNKERLLIFENEDDFSCEHHVLSLACTFQNDLQREMMIIILNHNYTFQQLANRIANHEKIMEKYVGAAFTDILANGNLRIHEGGIIYYAVPVSLMESCRNVILRNISSFKLENHIESLGIPKTLKSYLLYKKE